jgi:hypothetical protein
MRSATDFFVGQIIAYYDSGERCIGSIHDINVDQLVVKDHKLNILVQVHWKQCWKMKPKKKKEPEPIILPFIAGEDIRAGDVCVLDIKTSKAMLARKPNF